MLKKTSTAFKSPEQKKTCLAAYREILGLWPVPYQMKVVTTEYGKTNVLVCGKENAPALILLHGAGGNASIWVLMIKQLSKHFRIYAIDIIGEPGLSESHRLATPDEYPYWLYDVIKRLALNNITLCGFSLGATIACHFVEQYPSRIKQLILISPAYLSSPRISFLVRLLLRHVLPFPFMILHFLNHLISGHKLSKRMMKLFIKQYQAYRFNPLLIKLKPIKPRFFNRALMPVLVLLGKEESVYRLRQSIKKCQSMQNNIRVELIEGAGDFMIFQQPDSITELIKHTVSG